MRILVITSRTTKRFIVPKGWPMKDIEDRKVAEIEALEEAGLVGRAHPKPIGSYLTRKFDDHGGSQPVRVKVFLLDVREQLTEWKEKGQRERYWLSASDAADLIDEPGLADLVRVLPKHLPKSWRASHSSLLA